MMMKKILERLFEYKTLERGEAARIMLQVAGGQYNATELTAFITVFLMRSITISELQGFRDGLLELALPAPIESDDLVDIVGTGGDGRNTFNISTLACFVVAGAGVPVAKHGNYGATSVSGASNVMEHLGYRFSNDTARLQREIDAAQFTFLHAPLFHPALKAVATIRREIGFRTFFNMLGPLVNPAPTNSTLVGVFSPEMGRVYNYLLQEKGTPFTIIHSLDGYDEISLTGDTKVITAKGEKVYAPEALGKRMVLPADLSGGQTVNDAAAIFMKILNRQGSWAQNAVVLANAAMSLHGTGRYENYDAAYDAAVESLESGRALRSFNTLINMQ